MTKEVKIRNLYEWVELLETLDKKGVELIYFEEFSIYTRHFACRS